MMCKYYIFKKKKKNNNILDFHFNFLLNFTKRENHSFFIPKQQKNFQDNNSYANFLSFKEYKQGGK